MTAERSGPPRLCVASPLFFPTYGGSQLRYLRYLPGFRQHGMEVRVFTGTATVDEVTPAAAVDGWSRFSIGDMLPVETLNGTPVHRVRLPDQKGWYRRLLFNQRLHSFCRDTAYRPHVLQLLGTLQIGSVPWIWKLRRMGIATLYSLTIASKVMPTGRRLDWKMRVNRRLFSSFDCIVTNNQPLASGLRDMGVRSRIEVIANGVDLGRFNPEGRRGGAHALRSGLNIAADELMILAVGAVSPRKGPDILVEAWSRLHRTCPRTHLVFVGPRYELSQPRHVAFQRRVDALVAASGAPERVHFVGVQDNVPDYLRAADLFVLPSKREGMPNSVIEAMACETAVVVTPFAGLSDDLGRPEEHFLLAPRDSDALAGALKRLAEDEELRRGLGARALRWVQENMDLDRSIGRYASLYEELATHSSAPPSGLNA